jgi:hypothetical protein
MQSAGTNARIMYKIYMKKSYRSEYYSLPIIALVCIPMLLPQLLTSEWQRCGSVVTQNLNAWPSSSLWPAYPL